MALRREDLTPEQFARQEAYDRSWAVQQVMLESPRMVAFLKEQIGRLDSGPSAPLLSREEFLARVVNPPA